MTMLSCTAHDKVSDNGGPHVHGAVKDDVSIELTTTTTTDGP